MIISATVQMSNEVYINLCVLASNACYLLVRSLRIRAVSYSLDCLQSPRKCLEHWKSSTSIGWVSFDQMVKKVEH